MKIPDEVRRDLEIRAPRQRVWAALTEPEQLLVVEPPGRFAFRWRPAGPGRPFTTVSITPEELADGASTRLPLVESGFASLPDQIETQSQKGNDEGWAHELQEFKEYLEAA